MGKGASTWRRRVADTPLFTLAATATLALGLGVTSAVQSLAITIFFKLPARRAMAVDPMAALRAECEPG